MNLGHRCVAEVADFHELIFGSLHQVTNRIDILGLEAIRRANRQLQFCQAEIQLRLQSRIAAASDGSRSGIHLRTEFDILHKRVQVLTKNLGRFD